MSDGRPRILIVDDDDNNRYTLERRLRQFVDAEIGIAKNGREALELLGREAFDLVLLDVHMPEMDGYTVLEQMQSDMRLREVPVIMVSAADDLESVIRCIKLGAVDYVSKPVKADLLRARVEATLAHKRLRDQEAGFLSRMQQEKKRADGLLHSLLPKNIAGELMARNTMAPRRYENVAVLFCDIVGFTPYCDRNTPEQVVGELDALIARFEDVVERHRLEKIKTIGDAFMATAGMLEYVENPALTAAECGLAMIEAASNGGGPWQVRVGVHQGPVVAGLMGRRSFLFDLWGDTVNVAARVTEHAEPNSVALTGSTWLNVRNEGRGRSVGLAELKGKGKIEIVRYLGRR
jgi:class 3 adenylate cyclase